MKVLSVGLVFCDIPLAPVPADILKVDNRKIKPAVPGTGGDALTVAMVLSKIGIEAALAGHVGADANGQFLLEELKRGKVDTEGVIVDADCSTAVSYILIEEDGERHFLVDSAINRNMKSSDIPDTAIREADLVFFGSALAMEGMTDAEIADLFHRAHRHGKTTALDVSVAVECTADCKLDLLRETLEETDIFIPSFEEAAFLAGTVELEEMVSVFSQFPIQILGIKLGEKGCLLTDFKEEIRIPAYKNVKVVDTTGAGDCFVAGFLCGFLKGFDLKAAGYLASAVSAHSIAAKGASTGVPDFQTLQRYVEAHSNEE